MKIEDFNKALDMFIDNVSIGFSESGATLEYDFDYETEMYAQLEVFEENNNISLISL